MKKILLINILVFSVSVAFGQIDKDSIYYKKDVDKSAQFIGGNKALIKWFIENMPCKPDNNYILEEISCCFVVEKNGSIGKIQTPKNTIPDLAKEAIRMVRLMPKWQPAEKDGEVVRSYFVLPVFVYNKDSIYSFVDERAEFPGGDRELMKWLNNNINYQYPSDIQGKVFVNFVVEKDGSITNVKVTKSVYPSLDNEAIRLVKSMPKWLPGKKDGEVVRSRFTLPVTFILK